MATVLWHGLLAVLTGVYGSIIFGMDCCMWKVLYILDAVLYSLHCVMDTRLIKALLEPCVWTYMHVP